MMTRFLRPLLAIVAIFSFVTLLAIEAADTRPRGGMGSRGSRTYTAPPATKTAPTTAAPIQRTQTPAATTAPRAGAPAAAAGAAAKPGLFNRPGLMGGLIAGALGAGLIGMLLGQGLFSNLAGFASIIGLLLQIALIGGVAYLAVRWWKSRSQPAEPQPAFAGMPASPTPPQQAFDAPAPEAPRPMAMQHSNGSGAPMGAPMSYGASSTHSAASGGPGSQYQQQQPAEPVDEIGIKPEDYDAFERLLGEIQTAYGKEDVSALRARVTPEMMGYLSEQLGENQSRGVVAQLSNIKLLQGDLAEAWAEGNVEYATVALRYELIDTLVDRNTRQVVEGDATKPVEAIELWTFMRSRNGGTWLLTAIQNTEEEEEGPDQGGQRY
jgi:predicted lipid-binding transport protein (Tim44 family)